jgi:hypothetical protein
MKLEIEYPVVLQAVPPRSTLSKTVFLKDVVVVDIPEYSASEATLALRQKRTDPNTNEHWMRNFLHINGGLFCGAKAPTIKAGKVPYEFGYERNQIISPIFHNDLHADAQEKIGSLKRLHKSNCYKHVFNQDVIDAYVERWDRRYRGVALALVKAKLPFLADIKLSKVEDDGVERARNAISKRVADIVIIDGRFHIKQSEPVYLANASENVHDPFVAARTMISEEEMLGEDTIDLSTAYFSADDLEGATAYAAEMWRIRKGDDVDYDAPLSGNAYEVVDPSALKFDGERVSALRAAECVRRNFMSSILPPAKGTANHVLQIVSDNFDKTSLETLVNYKNLVASLNTAVAGGSTDDLCVRIRECISGEDGNRFVKGEEAEMLEVALARWERREARRNFGLMF